MPGNVAYRHRQAPVLQRQHVVEVAAHLGGRQIGVGHLDAQQLRRQLGQDRGLDAPGGLQLHLLALALSYAAHVRRNVLVAVEEGAVTQQVAGADQQRHGDDQQRDRRL